jgi:hypothetical protein
MKVIGYLAWVLLLWLTGCAAGLGSFRPRVGQEQAVHVVWAEAFGRTDRPPLVRWLEGSALVCDCVEDGQRGFYIPAADEGKPQFQCRTGFTWSPLEVLVAWHGEESFALTALAHELLHAALLREGVVFERHHDRPDFFPRIDAANQRIIEAGR